MCPRCEGMGSVTDFDLTVLSDDSLSLNDGGLTIPGYKHGRLVWPHLPRLRLRPGQADPQIHQEGSDRNAPQRADQDLLATRTSSSRVDSLIAEAFVVYESDSERGAKGARS